MSELHSAAPEFVRAMAAVARDLMGKPTKETPSKAELRFGTRGSFAVNLDTGSWFDHEANEGGGVLDLVMRQKRIEKPAAIAWMRERGHLPKPATPKSATSRLIRSYSYADAAGNLLFEVCRFEPKDFRQRRPNGSGGWLWTMAGVRRVIYRLPSVAAAIAAGSPIHIVEGEKAADALSALGMTATCSPGGANKWRKEYAACLVGADVVILPDNDIPGRSHGAMVAASLHQNGAKSVRIVALPNLPEKGDVADWIAAGGTAADLEALVANASEPNTAGDAEPSPTAAGWQQPASKPARKARAQPAPFPAPDPVMTARTAHHDLRAKLDKGDDGGVRPTHANLALILKYDAPLRDLVRLDAFAGRHLITKPVPVLDAGMPPAPGPYPRQWDAGDVTRILAYVQKEWSHAFRRSAVEESLMVEGQDRQFHPVRDWLASLLWDGVPRLDRWLTMTFGADLDDYHRAVGSKVLIAAVRRVRQPGCKFDHLVVLEGAQGIGKSTAIALLFGQQWTTDDVPADLGDKDAALALSGVWCVELSEIEPLIRSEAETVKAFLSRGTDRFRPPYGRQTIEVPRQCVLIGTTNATDYLRDTTGNRRIWPVECKSLASIGADMTWLAENRDQLWAEAAHLEAAGSPIWLDNLHIREVATGLQSARLADDPWADKVRAYVDLRADVRVADILKDALFVETPQQDKRCQMRVSAILQAAGWKRIFAWDADSKRAIRKWAKTGE